MGQKVDKSKTFSGEVLWFDDKLGYGFLVCKELGNNIFVHHTRIQSGENWKTLSKGQYVQFEITETQKGLMAVNIREQKVVPTTMKKIEPTTQTTKQ